MLSRGSRVRGLSTLGRVICKCHSGGVLRQPTGRGGKRGWDGEQARAGGGGGGAAVVFSHVDYSTTDAESFFRLCLQ